MDSHWKLLDLSGLSGRGQVIPYVTSSPFLPTFGRGNARGGGYSDPASDRSSSAPEREMRKTYLGGERRVKVTDDVSKDAESGSRSRPQAMIEMGEMGPDVIMPDERAAGVISGSDPYRELELYLEKVNEEFGEVFERWLGHSEKQKISALPKQNGGFKQSIFPVKNKIACNGNLIKGNSKSGTSNQELQALRTKSLPSTVKLSRRKRLDASRLDRKKALEKEWSENLMADFDRLIAKELNQLRKEVDKERQSQPDRNGNLEGLKNPKTYVRSFSDDPCINKSCDLLDPEKFIILEDIQYHSLPIKQNGEVILVKISPVKENAEKASSDSELQQKTDRIKEFFRNTSPFGKRGMAEINNAKVPEEGKGNYRQPSDDIPPPVPVRKKKLAQKIPAGLQNLLTNLRPDGSPPEVEEKEVSKEPPVSVATQTSPALSRSSSFTWLSDCSSSLALAPGFASDDKLSTTSSRSSSSPHRLRCDNGCGSECDCITSESRDSSPESRTETNRTKVARKETWERIRRRQSELLRVGRNRTDDPDVWIRRESVHTQTNDEETDREPTDEEMTISEVYGLQSRAENETGSTAIHSLPLRLERGPRPQNLSITGGSPHSGKQLPSPSTVSLKLPTKPLTPELGNKSSSAPVIMKQFVSMEKEALNQETKKTVPKQSRSQSERFLTEAEAAEACKWLKAAGFPQYVQMFEDHQFPIQVNSVQTDHQFLDVDSLQSLYRRLYALNRCAQMKVDRSRKRSVEDSDEDPCALSENWTFQYESRRWSRVCSLSAHGVDAARAMAFFPGDRVPPCAWESEPQTSSGEDLITGDVPAAAENLPCASTSQAAMAEENEAFAAYFRRTRSERLRDGAKALLKRMESLNSRRRKRSNRENEGSGLENLDKTKNVPEELKDVNSSEVERDTLSMPGTSIGVTQIPSSQPTGAMVLNKKSAVATLSPPPPPPVLSVPLADDSSSYCSDNSQGTPASQRSKSKFQRAKKFFYRKNEECGAFSDSEAQPSTWREQFLRDGNSIHPRIGYASECGGEEREESPSCKQMSPRGGSLNLGRESQRYRERVQSSFRRKRFGGIARYMEKSGSSELTEDSSSTVASQADSEQDPSHITRRRRVITVVRWHSFQRGNFRPDPYQHCNAFDSIPCDIRSMNALSSCQLLVLRKMALLKLTSFMERFCPSHRTGWNWELPKFMKKFKAPEYKDKSVFGVPVALSLQRSGQPLPIAIQNALKWLRTNALDQVGLFRKSGVRSRIITLRALTEKEKENVSYDEHQIYDVADLVKQYFRELPEALLTNKLSETFISIFQYVPEQLRPEAVQWVILLLPDEHREVLQTVLNFLIQVSAKSTYNQMTESNLAICFAPSLFHFQYQAIAPQSKSSSSSPKSKKCAGVPDQKELDENKAAHDCLLYMINGYEEIFIVDGDSFANCRFTIMDYSIPMTLEELGSELPDGWRGYLRESITSFLKEAKEKSRGWVNAPYRLDQLVEIASKKIRDGHPLRLWKVWTDVEAPPLELMRRVLRERHIWDRNLIKSRIITKLDQQSEIFQYVRESMAPLPPKDFCVLRSWRTDLPKGACVIVETSVEHPDAPVLIGGIRGVVLASRYLIEPCGSGRSRIVHLSRVDTKGRSPEWYNKNYGHICAMFLSNIRSSFMHSADGPESKV